MFNSLVEPVLLYGSETLKMNKGNDKLVDTFMFGCLRYILKIYWQLGWQSWNEAKRVAADRIKWIGRVKALYATGHEDDR